MKRSGHNPDKELYRQFRTLSWERLWNVEVAQFNGATQDARAGMVALIRAVGVVFLESGPPELRDEVRAWLRALLADPHEKIRRYAMNALPKVGAGNEEEERMLKMLRSTDIEREKKFLTGALEKIGGERTLTLVRGHLPQTEQKTRAALARSGNPGVLRRDGILEKIEDIQIHLRGRRGLEDVVRREVEESAPTMFRVVNVTGGLVAIAPLRPFSLGDLYALRCFGTAGFFLGTAAPEGLAGIISSPTARKILETFTGGAPRYRLDFVSKGHQRGAVRKLANEVYARCPDILNDPRNALWAMDIHSTGAGESVELRPRFSPDPRFAYRVRSLPAASHPPLAASMAWLAGMMHNEIVWDPFCGSGIELIECAKRGGVRWLHGTDLSADAVTAAQLNFAASDTGPVNATFTCTDFRDHAGVEGGGPGQVSLIVTNPPLGMRVPVPNLRELIHDLFDVASRALKAGGRLIFVNPIRLESPHPSLRLQSRRLVDMSGFDCRLEVWLKTGG